MKIYFAILALISFSFSVSAKNKTLNCDQASSTLEINQCAYIELERAKNALALYLEKTLSHHEADSRLTDSIKAAQKNWQTYVSSHCDSVYTQWRDGSIRFAMAIKCQTNLTKERTHEIWSNFLTYIDGSPAVLPEPA